jgi:hypothetical protein
LQILAAVWLPDVLQNIVAYPIFVKIYAFSHEFPMEVFHKKSDLMLIMWDFYCIINTKSEKKRI